MNKRTILRLGRGGAGVMLCGAAALLLAGSSLQRPWRIFVPLVFVGIIVLLAARFGLAVSVLGSVLAALIFAYFLFPPLRSFHIENRTERDAIAWMVLAGLTLPFLLLPPHPPGSRRK